jgi:hypothetical protein
MAAHLRSQQSENWHSFRTQNSFVCAGFFGAAVSINIDAGAQTNWGTPAEGRGAGPNACAPDGGCLRQYKWLGRSGPYSAHRTRCRADAVRSPRSNSNDLRRREHRRTNRGTNAANGVWPLRLHLRQAVQPQLGTPHAVCELKIVCKIGPCALSCLSAEGAGPAPAIPILQTRLRVLRSVDKKCTRANATARSIQ